MPGQAKQGSELSQSGGQEKKVAEGSEERSESERKAAEEAARKKKLEMDVWGHLPPHLRDQLLNTMASGCCRSISIWSSNSTKLFLNKLTRHRGDDAMSSWFTNDRPSGIRQQCFATSIFHQV